MTWDDIQKVFVISLPGSPRRDKVREELISNGILFEFWDGIRNNEDGAIGLKQTFKNIFTTCLQKGHNNVLIFEDDAKFNYSMAQHEMQWVMEDLPTEYHILKFGANLLLPIVKITDYISMNRMSYALHAALYSRVGMEVILKNLSADKPIDFDIAKNVEPYGECYVSNKMIVTQRPTKSDIFVYDPVKHNKAFIDKYVTGTGIVRWDLFMSEQWERNTKHLNQNI